MDIAKHPSIDGLFFECAVESLSDPIGLRFAYKSKTRLDAPESDLLQEVVRQILGSMIHAERKPTRQASPDSAIDVVESHRDRLQSRIAGPVFDHMPADALGAPVLDRREQPDVTVIECKNLGSIGTPHDIGPLGDDGARVLFARGLPASIRTQELVFPHDPKNSLARDTDLIHDSQPRPHLAVAFALKRRASQVSSNLAQQFGIAPLRLGTALLSQGGWLSAASVVAPPGNRSWNEAAPRWHRRARLRRLWLRSGR